MVHLTPQWGSALTEIQRRAVYPALRVAVVPDGDEVADGRPTLLRRGSPCDTGLVVGSADLVVAEGPELLTIGDHGTWLAEASWILRSGGQLGLHVLGGSEGDHPLSLASSLRTPRAWATALEAVGFEILEMRGATWRWPSWSHLLIEAGAGRCLDRARRLTRLDGGGQERGRVRRLWYEAAQRLIGLAVVARRR